MNRKWFQTGSFSLIADFELLMEQNLPCLRPSKRLRMHRGLANTPAKKIMVASRRKPTSGLIVMTIYPHVRSLKIRNLKSIAELDIQLDNSLTLVAGVNGVGKTSMIEALLRAVTDVWNWLGPVGQHTGYTIPGDPLRYGATEGGIEIELDVKRDCPVNCAVPLQDTASVSEDYSDSIPNDLQGKMCSLPLVVNYSQIRTGRLEPAKRHRERSVDLHNRHEALDTNSFALADFTNWFIEKEGDEAREAKARGDLKYVDPEVRAVQKVLKRVAGSSTSLISRKPDGKMGRVLFLRKEGGLDIPFEALSGGELAYFLLAVDLARRLLLEFPDKSLADAPGIVCIDEIELHLHPAWQRQVLKFLMDLFRGCQFVVTTHSPQVIAGVEAQHVRLLSSNQDSAIDVTEPIASKGRDTNYVLAGIMKTPEQDPEVRDRFKRFDRLVDDGELDEADRVLDELDQLVEGQSSRVSHRRAKCRRLRRAHE